MRVEAHVGLHVMYSLLLSILTKIGKYQQIVVKFSINFRKNKYSNSRVLLADIQTCWS